MKSTDLEEPITATVINDPYQESENVAYAVPVNTPAIGIPVYVNSQPQRSDMYGVNNDDYMAAYRVSAQLDVGILQARSLARSIGFLAAIDSIIIVLLGLFNYFWLFFLWGPLCGYYGAKRFIASYIYIYAFYWLLRVGIDLYAASFGYWWYIVSVIIDVFILRYVILFARLLRELTDDNIEILRGI